VTVPELKLRYYRACVRIYAGHDVNRWTPQELIEAFVALPAPAVNFSDWLDATKYKADDAPAFTATVPPGLTEAEQAKANETALAALAAAKAANPDGLNFVSVS
jgi:hypothetical protein